MSPYAIATWPSTTMPVTWMSTNTTIPFLQYQSFWPEPLLTLAPRERDRVALAAIPRPRPPAPRPAYDVAPVLRPLVAMDGRRARRTRRRWQARRA